MVPGLTPISLVSGLRKWCVTDMVSCRPMLNRGNLLVVNPSVEQIDVLVLSMITHRKRRPPLLVSLWTILVVNLLALRFVALPLTVTILMLPPKITVPTVPPVRLMCPNLGMGQMMPALSIPLAGLMIVIP